MDQSTTTSRSDCLVSGRYRIDRVIGRGGMSTVYLARDMVLDRPVAVKVLLPALAEEDPSHVARLQREARAAAALRHRSVVKVYDTGSDEGSHFIVMEYVAGQGLEAVIRERRLDAREAARISADVAEAVAAAHAAGILHRDIKPANVIITSDGGVKVLDFGIARTVREATITQPAFAIGTAAYMPPERSRDELATNARISTHWGVSSTRCSPAGRRSSPTRPWPSSISRSTPSRRACERPERGSHRGSSGS